MLPNPINVKSYIPGARGPTKGLPSIGRRGGRPTERQFSSPKAIQLSGKIILRLLSAPHHVV